MTEKLWEVWLDGEDENDLPEDQAELEKWEDGDDDEEGGDNWYGEGLELSVIRTDNKWGHGTAGYGGKGKIILGEEIMTKEDLKYWKPIAQLLCDALNERGEDPNYKQEYNEEGFDEGGDD